MNKDGYQYEYKASNLWSEEDTEYLIEYHKSTSEKDLAYALDKTQNQVRSRLRVLRNGGYIEGKYDYHNWTQEDEDFIKENYGKLTPSEIAKRIGVNKRKLEGRIKKMRAEGVDIHSFRPKTIEWTKEMDRKLIGMYPYLTYAEMSKVLKVSCATISIRATQLSEDGLLQLRGKGQRIRW